MKLDLLTFWRFRFFFFKSRADSENFIRFYDNIIEKECVIYTYIVSFISNLQSTSTLSKFKFKKEVNTKRDRISGRVRVGRSSSWNLLLEDTFLLFSLLNSLSSKISKAFACKFSKKTKKKRTNVRWPLVFFEKHSHWVSPCSIISQSNWIAEKERKTNGNLYNRFLEYGRLFYSIFLDYPLLLDSHAIIRM